MVELYRDRWVICTDTHVVIRWYYFPLGTSKAIGYADIKSVSSVEMGALTGGWRLWGTSSPRYWAHLDLHRPRKTTALVLDLGRRVRPFITPANPKRVRDLIEARSA
jgi:hypothetical protein